MNAAEADRQEDFHRETRELDTRELFGAADELLIVHKGVRYRLRITRQDKLILTK